MDSLVEPFAVFLFGVSSVYTSSGATIAVLILNLLWLLRRIQQKTYRKQPGVYYDLAFPCIVVALVGWFFHQRSKEDLNQPDFPLSTGWVSYKNNSPRFPILMALCATIIVTKFLADNMTRCRRCLARRQLRKGEQAGSVKEMVPVPKQDMTAIDVVGGTGATTKSAEKKPAAQNKCCLVTGLPRLILSGALKGLRVCFLLDGPPFVPKPEHKNKIRSWIRFLTQTVSVC